MIGIRLGVAFGGKSGVDWNAYWATRTDTWYSNVSCTDDDLFIILGDKTSTPNVAEATGINLVIKSFNPDYVIGTGDFEDATRAVADLNVNLTTLDGNIYATPGNHDTDKNSNRTDFNAFYGDGISGVGSYQKKSTTNIDLFIIDNYLNDAEDGYLTCLQTEARTVVDFKATTQGQWLISQLAASTAKWKILLTHQPPWSSANEEGDPGTIFNLYALRWDWADYGVDLIICGHCHFYERLLINTGSGNVPIIICGTSGGIHINHGAAISGSLVRINENTDVDFNAGMLPVFRAGVDSLVFDLMAINSSFIVDAVIKDTLILRK